MRHEQSYYISLQPSSNDNIPRTDVDLTVNCTGITHRTFFFETDRPHGRRDYYLQYVLHGEMNVWTEDGIEVIRPGQAILYYPNTLCHYEMRGTDALQYYWIHFTGWEADNFVQKCGLPGTKVLTIQDGSFLTSVFENLLRDFIRRDDLFEISIGNQVRTILIEISRQSSLPTVSPKSDRITDAIAHIHRHYSEDLSIKDVASKYYLSESRFRTLFKEKTGHSPKEYQMILRINRAKEALLDTRLSLREISEMVGYSDQLYFSRIFTQRVGISPSEYRKTSAT